jgi:glucose-1-phosphate thymidylyltransferase
LKIFESFLEDGKHLGINISYEIQEKPEGIAQAFIIGEKFIGNSNVALILGDNIFYGEGISTLLRSANKRNEPSIFAYRVGDPERYGVVEFSKDGRVIGIEEKPKKPKSKYAITGIYFYDNSVIEKAKKLIPSDRRELEITDINQMYLKENLLNVEIMGRGMAWFDTGTFDSLYEASAYIHTLEHRQGLKVGCLEEIAWRQKWISNQEIRNLCRKIINNDYSKYLLDLLEN